MVTNFAKNYCNLYDKGYGINEYTWNDAKTNYVLDMRGNLLNTTHNAHIWTQGQSDAAATSWPGRKMNQVGTSRFYEVTFKGTFANVIFTNKNEGEGQTADLSTGSNGQVWVLQSDWNGAWVSMEAAEFIDSYMKFNEYGKDEHTSPVPTADCDDNWNAAKAAYNALSSDAVRLEVLSVGDVADRFGHWAEAHNATLDTAAGGELTSLRATANNLVNNYVPVIIVISSIFVVTILGAGLMIKRRKEDR